MVVVYEEMRRKSGKKPDHANYVALSMLKEHIFPMHNQPMENGILFF